MSPRVSVSVCVCARPSASLNSPRIVFSATPTPHPRSIPPPSEHCVSCKKHSRTGMTLLPVINFSWNNFTSTHTHTHTQTAREGHTHTPGNKTHLNSFRLFLHILRHFSDFFLEGGEEGRSRSGERRGTGASGREQVDEGAIKGVGEVLI